MKNRTKSVRTMLSLLLAAGVILGVLGILLGVFQAYWRRSDPRISGRITRIEDGTTWVAYTYDGVTYENVPLNSTSSSRHVGDSITLRMNPGNPGRPGELITDLIGPGVLCFISFDLLLLSGILIVVLDPWDRKRKLMNTGHRIYAYVDEVTVNTYVTVNGHHPFVIRCSTHAAADPKTYKSGNLWVDPRRFYPVGKAIPVYIDPEKPSRYYVDAKSAMERYGGGSI